MPPLFLRSGVGWHGSFVGNEDDRLSLSNSQFFNQVELLFLALKIVKKRRITQFMTPPFSRDRRDLDDTFIPTGLSLCQPWLAFQYRTYILSVPMLLQEQNKS